MKKTTTIIEENGKTTTTTVIENIPKKSFHAQILIDNSGSMNGWQNKVVSGVNEYAQTLKNTTKSEGIDATIAVSFFSDMYMGVHFNHVRPALNIDEFRPLVLDEILPNGGTPLLDAIGDLINSKMVSYNNQNVALVILTDGEENSSRRYRASMIKELLDRKQKQDNWLVIYLGANQDAWNVGDSMGTEQGFTAGFDMNKMNKAFDLASASSMRYATTGSVLTANFTEQERAMLKDK